MQSLPGRVPACGCRLVEAGGTAPQAPSPNGLPTISDMYDPRDGGTDWPLGAFSGMVVGHESPQSIGRPARHSYDGDGSVDKNDRQSYALCEDAGD